MKAPELPAKIYFTILDMGSGYVITPSLDDNGGTEYIRKEALLEWLNSEIKKEMEDHYDDFSFGIAYGNVLEHINEM